MFKIYQRVLFALTILMFSSTHIVLAAGISPKQQSCELIEALVKGTDASIPNMKTLLGALSPEKVELLASQMSGLLSDRTYKSGLLYNIGSLGNNMQEHLLVLEATNGGISNFFRLIYQSYGQDLRVVDFVYEPGFKAIMKRNILSSPVEIPCK